MHSSTSTNKDTIFKSPDDGSLINQYEILAQYQKYERDSLPCQQMNNFRQVCDGKLFSDEERENNNLSRNLRFVMSVYNLKKLNELQHSKIIKNSYQHLDYSY
ncbi:hypothetical protein ACKWTF_015795 [Chironomus riparius]